MDYGFAPYVPVAVRQARARRQMEKRRKAGIPVSPVRVEGREIAKTFWGSAWCSNLERYSDFENRLPRGRTYVRNGSVVDLQVSEGKVAAFVAGSELYEVSVSVSAVPAPRWKSLVKDCAGTVASLVDLLRGRFERGVMERLCRPNGLFPSPREIRFTCTCPDFASMCKHVAATLYGIGARLDEKPELLFRLRKVSEQDLLAQAGKDLPLSGKRPSSRRVLAASEVAAVFGIEVDVPATPPRKRRAAAEASVPERPAPPKKGVARRPRS